MTLLKRAIIKSYDGGQHRAAVGIAGSLSVWLEDIAVSDAIPSAAVVAGRECSVLFHTDDNPTDAVVVAVRGGGPPAATVDRIIDADGDTVVHVEKTADDDTIRFENGGAENANLDASGRWRWMQRWGHVLNGISPAHDPLRALSWTDSFFGPESVGAGERVILFLNPVLRPTVTDQNFFSVGGNMILTPNSGIDVGIMAGLNFAVIPDAVGSTTYDEVAAVRTQVGNLFAGNARVTELTGFHHVPPIAPITGSPIYTRYASFWSENPGTAKATTVVGLRISDITAGSNKYLIYAGPQTPGPGSIPNLRLDAGLPANAASATEGDSQLQLGFNENGVMILRQTRWKQQSTLAGTDKVMIAV